jgi:hypothetical protein
MMALINPILPGVLQGLIASCVNPQFANSVTYLSIALFRTIILLFRVTQFAAVLHAGSLVSCHNFLRFLFSFN